MTTVNVGTFNILKQLPENTHLLAAWSARWTFGNVKANPDSGTYAKQIPMIRENLFWTSRNALADLAVPGTHPALVVELKTVSVGARSSLKSFPALKHNIVATPEDKAWIVPSVEYWNAINRYAHTLPSISLAEIPSFTLSSLVGEAEFKKMIVELRAIVKKL